MFYISEKANPNYLAKFVEISNIRKHPNADRLQVTTIDGNDVITGTDIKVGDNVVYFPLECAINKDFLSATNSFEDKELNFENLEGYKSNNVDDGIEYRFQYYFNGKYNVITRNNPQTGKGYDAVFLQITDLMYSLKK